MTDCKLRIAANMRIDGRSWEEIGRELSYDPSYIRRVVLARIQQSGPDCRYPALGQVIREKFGSLSSFAGVLGVSRQYIYRVMQGDVNMNARLRDAICEATGLSAQELEGE